VHILLAVAAAAGLTLRITTDWHKGRIVDTKQQQYERNC
jgi:hypothetical protein